MQLADWGTALRRARPVDMFPHTLTWVVSCSSSRKTFVKSGAFPPESGIALGMEPDSPPYSFWRSPHCRPPLQLTAPSRSRAPASPEGRALSRRATPSPGATPTTKPHQVTLDKTTCSHVIAAGASASCTFRAGGKFNYRDPTQPGAPSAARSRSPGRGPRSRSLPRAKWRPTPLR